MDGRKLMGARTLGAMAGAAVGLTATAMVARMVARRMRTYSFENKHVLIAGGSRGLGLVLARQLAADGARLGLVARDKDELLRAAAELTAGGALVEIVAADISRKEEVERAVRRIEQRFGTVDVLINDAGIIETGPLETMTRSDFEESMGVHFWGPLELTLAVLPGMRQKKQGRIINISSIGGKVSVPHLLPYCASKFALTGLSEGLRAELAKDNIFITTVCPGMMRTGSHINAYFKGNNQAEFAWFSIGNALPFLSTSDVQAAKEILRAARRGDPELIITLAAQLATKVNGMFPGFVSEGMSMANRFLPPAGGNGTAKISGQESRSWMSPRWLTWLSDKQSPVNNELRETG